MRLSGTVETSDVQEAIRLMRVATQQAATDPTTGCIDMNMISTGITANSRERVRKIVDCLKDILVINKIKKIKNLKYIKLKKANEDSKMFKPFIDLKVLRTSLENKMNVLEDQVNINKK